MRYGRATSASNASTTRTANPIVSAHSSGRGRRERRARTGHRLALGYSQAVRPPALYNLIAVLSAPVLYGLFRLRVRGGEHVPSGGSVLASNHLSNFDPWPI